MASLLIEATHSTIILSMFMDDPNIIRNKLIDIILTADDIVQGLDKKSDLLLDIEDPIKNIIEGIKEKFDLLLAEKKIETAPDFDAQLALLRADPIGNKDAVLTFIEQTLVTLSNVTGEKYSTKIPRVSHIFGGV